MLDFKIDVVDKEYHLVSYQGNFLGKLAYENWVKTKASITTQFGEFYELTQKGFWKTHVEVEIGGDLFATLRHNWRMQAVIDIVENDIDRDYLVKTKGFWKTYFVVLNRDEKEIMKLIPQTKWFNNTSFYVEIEPSYKSIVNETLILIVLYCVNSIKSRRKAAAAAAG
jgi:hypothetical protein